MTSTPEPEPETSASPEPEREVKTLFPEVMGNQEAFLMYGVFIFLLFVFFIVLLVLYIKLKKRLKKLGDTQNMNHSMRASMGKVDPAVF